MKYLIVMLMAAFVICGCERNNSNPSEFTDSRDGTIYESAQIGSQIWMTENLAYLPAVNNPDDGSEDSPRHYIYDYLNASVPEAQTTVNYQTHGVLYNWPAANEACPDGWHLPSDQEWMALEEHLGMSSSDAHSREVRTSGAVGKKLKSNGDWYSNGSGNNNSGLDVHPGGKRDPDIGGSIFVMLGSYSFYWTSTPHGMPIAWYRGLNFNSDGVVRSDENYGYGFSVRCVKN